MKAMFAAFVATGLIALGAWYGLHQAGFSAGEHNAGDAVRLGDG